MSKMKKIILIVTKHPKSRGGVVNYYNNFFKVFDLDGFDLKWFTLGSRPEDYYKRNHRNTSYFFELIKDILSFIYLLIINKDIIIVKLNPSLIPIPIFRDSIFLLIAKIFQKKTIIFFRGWSREFEHKLIANPIYSKFILKLFKSSDSVLVLAEKFKNFLIQQGFMDDKISITRTMYLQKNILPKKLDYDDSLKFIYVGRISLMKGINDLVDAVKLLKQNGIKIRVDLFGHYADKEIRKIVNSKINNYSLENEIKINDFITGSEKYKKLSESDVFLFPTYNEGCPNSIIEALASGLFIISTPVGALDEIVLNNINGKIVPIKSPESIAETMKWCVNNKDEVRRLGKLNARYASNNFEQKVILKQILDIYKKLI